MQMEVKKVSPNLKVFFNFRLVEQLMYLIHTKQITHKRVVQDDLDSFLWKDQLFKLKQSNKGKGGSQNKQIKPKYFQILLITITFSLDILLVSLPEKRKEVENIYVF